MCDVSLAPPGYDRACATASGIQALRNFADVREFAAAVYPHPEYLKTLATSTPIRRPELAEAKTYLAQN